MAVHVEPPVADITTQKVVPKHVMPHSLVIIILEKSVNVENARLIWDHLPACLAAQRTRKDPYAGR